MSRLNSASFMHNTLCRQVGGMSQFLRRESAEMFVHAICTNLRNPFSFDGVVCNTKQLPGLVAMGSMKVLHIHRPTNIPKVRNTVVMSHSVYMVNVTDWLNSMNIKPRKSLRLIPDVINANSPIPSLTKSSNNNTKVLGSIEWNLNSGENSRIGVVVEKLAQTRCGKISSSHDTVSSLIGQKLARVCSTCGLRYFRGNHVL